MSVLLQTLAAFVIGAIIAVGVQHARNASPRAEGSQKELYCPWAVFLLPVFLLLLFGGMFAIAAATVDVDESKDAVVIGVLGLIALGAALVTWTLNKSRIRWNEQELVWETAWRPAQRCSWREVADVRYSAISGALKITSAGADSTLLKVPLHYKGIASFVDAIEKNLPPERYEGAGDAIKRIREGRA